MNVSKSPIILVNHGYALVHWSKKRFLDDPLVNKNVFLVIRYQKTAFFDDPLVKKRFFGDPLVKKTLFW